MHIHANNNISINNQQTLHYLDKAIRNAHVIYAGYLTPRLWLLRML